MIDAVATQVFKCHWRRKATERRIGCNEREVGIERTRDIEHVACYETNVTPQRADLCGSRRVDFDARNLRAARKRRDKASISNGGFEQLCPRCIAEDVLNRYRHRERRRILLVLDRRGSPVSERRLMLCERDGELECFCVCLLMTGKQAAMHRRFNGFLHGPKPRVGYFERASFAIDQATEVPQIAGIHVFASQHLVNERVGTKRQRLRRRCAKVRCGKGRRRSVIALHSARLQVALAGHGSINERHVTGAVVIAAHDMPQRIAPDDCTVLLPLLGGVGGLPRDPNPDIRQRQIPDDVRREYLSQRARLDIRAAAYERLSRS
ncbi:hypothetical protein [Trinickia sp. EG282A]|uniref:hypothetical protein n=1 Tax=Trinickia sp. EG282A TaxID=3237013 RepID=UPI0034D1F92A